MMMLYEHPLSAYAMKVKIALNEKGVEYRTAVPEGMGKGKAGGEFVSANPRAEVPTLIDGDVAIFDSTIMLEYLEDKWPKPALLPHSPADRARVRMIEDVMDIRNTNRITGGLSKCCATGAQVARSRRSCWPTENATSSNCSAGSTNSLAHAPGSTAARSAGAICR